MIYRRAAGTAEHARLQASRDRRADWKAWGPYLSERAWGTVREDYSASGAAWDYFPHDHARSRAYRWNEDGLGGFCNRYQNVCLAVALWNERDPFLKERLFGVTGKEGNHGEDVKEYYYYLDGVPSHAYMSMLYRYPQVAFPYEALVRENQRRGFDDPEFELLDCLRQTFEAERFFDVFIEYAKRGEDDILCRITAHNRGPDPAPLHILPHVWCRNNWSWRKGKPRPRLEQAAPGVVHGDHRHAGDCYWYAATGDGEPLPLWFTENETNLARVYGTANSNPYVKDAFHAALVDGAAGVVNPDQVGTKAAGRARFELAPGAQAEVRVRFALAPCDDPWDGFAETFATRRAETDAFHAALAGPDLDEDGRRVQRQALAGLLWSKQFYHFHVGGWIAGDDAQPPPPPGRGKIRNGDWRHLHAVDVHAMPDCWEYPWFAAWDTAFHTLPLALMDPEWAKRQLILLTREWYMHPSGQLPAYEWNFSDVNPPVHAFAAWQVYHRTRGADGRGDLDFLERIFHKLLLNFTWWVNRKDADGNNVFEGGFLGLDNIGVFNRSEPLPTGGHLEQADGTAWMAMYCLDMLTIALELATHRPAYEDVATKFFEHFVLISHAIFEAHGKGVGLWDEQDNFFYDVLHDDDGTTFEPLRVRSFVGLIPLLACQVIPPTVFEKVPRFRRRLDWFFKYRPGLMRDLQMPEAPGAGGFYCLAICNRERLGQLLQRVLDESEFLSPYGLRSLSRFHERQPYEYRVDERVFRVAYQPGEARSGLFGGNSNWRGPIWFPINYLIVDALRRYHHHYGDSLQVEMPTGSGHMMDLRSVSNELARRLSGIFRRDPETGRRAVLGDDPLLQQSPLWRDHIPFYEYFHGDHARGLGASHQTGWTALVANLVE